jgi:hypothetical protein
MILFPKLAARSCTTCRQWIYRRDGSVETKWGKPLERRPLIGLPLAPTECYDCPKIPDGMGKVSNNAIEPSDRHWQAYEFHLRCRAVGRFPVDNIVERNAVIFEEVIRIRDQEQQVNGILLGLRKAISK